jgi:hypothetical protein
MLDQYGNPAIVVDHMHTPAKLSHMFAGGDRRSNKQTDAVLAIVLLDRRKIPTLVKCLWDQDACVRMRAADALEKLSREHGRWLQPFKKRLLGLGAESTQKEVRWHVAVMVPRLQLTTSELAQAADFLQNYLNGYSSIVKTFAMQGLSDLAEKHAVLRPRVVELIRVLTRSGTPAMRARGRILLRRLESA